MFERFTPEAREVVVKAQTEARRLDHAYIGSEHVLLGLLWDHRGLPAQALAPFGVDAETVREEIVARVGRGDGSSPAQIPFTPKAKQILEMGLREALTLRQKMIRPDHLLLGLLRTNDATALQILVDRGVDPVMLHARIVGRLGIPEPRPDPASSQDQPEL